MSTSEIGGGEGGGAGGGSIVWMVARTSRALVLRLTPETARGDRYTCASSSFSVESPG